jgi:hypothetical protein
MGFLNCIITAANSRTFSHLLLKRIQIYILSATIFHSILRFFLLTSCLIRRILDPHSTAATSCTNFIANDFICNVNLNRGGNFSTVQIVLVSWTVSWTGSSFRKRTRGNVRTGYSHAREPQPAPRPQRPPEHEIFNSEPHRNLLKCSRRLNKGARYDAWLHGAWYTYLLGMRRCTTPLQQQRR